MSRDAQQEPDGTKPPFLQAQITKPAYRITTNLYAGHAHDGLPIQSLHIESVKPAILKSKKMCASDSPQGGGDFLSSVRKTLASECGRHHGMGNGLRSGRIKAFWVGSHQHHFKVCAGKPTGIFQFCGVEFDFGGCGFGDHADHQA